MQGQHPRAGAPRRRIVAFITVALAAVATAALVSVAVARTFTLQIAKGARVTNAMTGTTTLANIVVNSHGMAVYTLTGDSKSHPECIKSSGCLALWPPVTVASAKKLTHASGIHGRFGTWHRGGFTQVTLNGRPLYTFSGDSQRHHATGEGIVHFGGTWHVVKTSSSTSSSPPSPPPNPYPGS